MAEIIKTLFDFRLQAVDQYVGHDTEAEEREGDDIFSDLHPLGGSVQ